MDRRRFLALPLLGALHNLLPAAASWQASGRHGAVAAMVQVPADGVMHVTSGCACEGGYHAVSLA